MRSVTIKKTKAQLNCSFIFPVEEQFTPDDYLCFGNDLFEKATKEILGFDKQLTINLTKEIPIKKEILKDRKNIPNIENVLINSGPPYLNFFLKFTLKSELEVSNLEFGFYQSEDNNRLKEDLALQAYLKALVKIHRLFLCSNIAKMGALYCYEGMFLVDEKFYMKLPCYNSSIFESYEMALIKKWPKINELKIKDVHQWIEEIESTDKSSLKTAVGALSHIFFETDDGDTCVDLIWSVIGIEAVFGQTSGGVREQLLERIEKFLGNYRNGIKLIKDIYNYRSLYLHGKIEVPLSYKSKSKIREKDTSKAGELSGMAVAILVSTIQKCIIEKWTEIKYEYRLIGT